MEPIILASSSSRRQEFFKLLGLPFSVFPSKIDENLVTETDPEKLTLELSIKKVEKVIEVMNKRLPKWICGADTVIVSRKKILGKAQNRDEASKMLKELSGRNHKAVTSVSIFNGYTKKMDSCTVTCTVSFAALTEPEIEWYLDTNEWQGVAGAYRIQGLASCFINRIEGSPSTVIGLPLREFYVMLRSNGYPFGACASG